MKNFLILGVLAVVLFSISAALSLWLNQSKQTVAEAEKAKTDKADKHGDEKGDDKHDKTEKKPPTKKGDDKHDTKEPGHKTETAPPGPEIGPKMIADNYAQQVRLERRAVQLELIMRDLQSQREAFEALLRQVTTELKTATAKAGELDNIAAELKKKEIDIATGERKNIEKMAAIYDQMSPESAAPILKQMADSGRLELAAKILAQMKGGKTARVLAELADPTLAAQLIDTMRRLNSGTPATTPAPGGPVVPVRGP